MLLRPPKLYLCVVTGWYAFPLVLREVDRTPAPSPCWEFESRFPRFINRYGSKGDLGFSVAIADQWLPTFGKEFERFTRFVVSTITPMYEKWFNQRSFHTTGESFSHPNRVLLDPFLDTKPPPLLMRLHPESVKRMHTRPRSMRFLDTWLFPKLWTESTCGAFIVTTTPLAPTPSEYEVVPRNWLDSFILQCAEWWAVETRDSVIVLNSPEEALFLFELFNKWPPLLRRPLVQQIFGSVLDFLPAWNSFLIFANRVGASTLDGYLGKLDVLRLEWNRYFPACACRSVAHFVAGCLDSDTWQPRWHQLVQSFLLQSSVEASISPSVATAVKKAAAHLCLALDWEVPACWGVTIAAVSRMFPTLASPCATLPLRLWFDLIAFSITWCQQRFSSLECHRRVLVAESVALTLNFLFLVALRPDEAVHLKSDSEVCLFHERVSSSSSPAISLLKLGAYIFLTKAKNIKPNGPPQLVCSLETLDTRFSVPHHVVRLRELREELSFASVSETLFFHPLTGRKWRYSELRTLWSHLITDARSSIPNFPKHAKLTLYTGRKSFVVAGIDLQIPQHVVQAVTRHSSLETLQRWYEDSYRYRRGPAWANAIDAQFPAS